MNEIVILEFLIEFNTFFYRFFVIYIILQQKGENSLLVGNLSYKNVQQELLKEGIIRIYVNVN